MIARRVGRRTGLVWLANQLDNGMVRILACTQLHARVRKNSRPRLRVKDQSAPRTGLKLARLIFPDSKHRAELVDLNFE